MLSRLLTTTPKITTAIASRSVIQLKLCRFISKSESKNEFTNESTAAQIPDNGLADALRLAKSRIASTRKATPISSDQNARHQGAGTVVKLTDEGPMVVSAPKGETSSSVSTDNIEDADENKLPVQITGFGGGTIGINNVFFHGSVAILPNMSFLWSPVSWSEVTVESLDFLRLLHPLPDLLLFGCGSVPKPIPASVNRFLTEMRIPFELQSTPHACGTFNILNEEKRRVVACLVALTPEEHAIYQQRGESRFTRKGLFNYED